MATAALLGWPREYTAAALLLIKAADFAAAEGRSPWDFAVELEDLLKAGLTKADLRRLICRGWVEQAEELVGSGANERVFRPVGLLTIGRHSCFVLTADGRAAIRPATFTSAPPADGGVPPAPGAPSPAPSAGAVPTCEPNSNGATQRAPETGAASALSASGNGHSRSGNGKLSGNGHDGNGHAHVELAHLKPVWDADLNRLTLGDIVVKEYRTPAPNQQCILAVFQEEGWPVRIDDPLPPHPEQDPKRRLHETIVSLNRNQRNELVRFCGDGHGIGIRWQLHIFSE